MDLTDAIGADSIATDEGVSMTQLRSRRAVIGVTATSS
jgi:hypothetical protein